MKRSSLFVCCGITLLYLSPRLDSRTVSPILYLTTDTPNVADSTGYYGGQSGYYDGGGSGQSGYYGRGASDKSGYYGGVSGQSRSYGSGYVPNGYYGGRPSTAAATTYGSYGHRTMPESAVQTAVQPVRNERSHALYESPNTYEYMTNPPRKSGKVSRVPETERLPPGDDVEFIDQRGGGGGGGDTKLPAKDRNRDGDGNGERSRDFDDRPRGHHQNNNNNNGKRTNRNKPKTKNGRKPSSTREDDYATDGGAEGGDAEPLGSSTTGDVRKGATAKKPRQDGREGTGRKNKKHGPGGGDAALPVKHKIHKKNEYSKRQQFFDEEHVDHGKKKPKTTTTPEGRKNNGREVRKQSKKKRQQQQQRPAEKPVKRTTPKIEKRNDPGTSRVVSQGYGQVMAVR